MFYFAEPVNFSCHHSLEQVPHKSPVNKTKSKNINLAVTFAKS